MPVEPGQIVNNLIPTEPVVVTKVQSLGSMMSIGYTGINSKRSDSKVITIDEFESLEIVSEEGTFNFQGDPEKFTLFAEAERINSAYQFDPLFAVNCSIIDPLPHQVEAVYKYLLPQPQIRFLLADDTGAGKTIMIGILLKELMMRGLSERILIVTPGGLTKQWQEDELDRKFNIPFTLVNRALFSSDPNVFHTANRIVTSIDFVCREDVLSVVSNSTWDVIVFDEAHKLSAYEYGSKVELSNRYRAAYALSQQCEHLLLLTATPHRGREDTFKRLLQLLDEDIFATVEIANERIKSVEKDGANKFFIRRLKETMKDWDGKPLFKERSTKTVAYELTPEEKNLYDAVTEYLIQKREEASEAGNIYVALALTVMQRRLVSSIYALRNTLFRRWTALQSLVDEVKKNPGLWNQRRKLNLDEFGVENIEDFEELEDDEREVLDGILSDPKKFRLFTTAKSISEIQEEANDVKRLYKMADDLYQTNQEEQKFIELTSLLTSQNVIDGEKLVLFTEHKDTLDYLEERLKNNGYNIVTIHGGKNVDERRQAQSDFMTPEVQILLATDAAGEGINLQFCRLLINWDIPWNPNRLEQRMGRIHRYGQKENVLVFNMVAENTKEGYVLERLLTKMDIIRESMGDDRVYDVIQDVLQGVKLEDIIDSVFNGKSTQFNEFLEQGTEQLTAEFTKKIEEHEKRLTNTKVDYKDAKILKENSDEKRLQPIYIRLFFDKAFQHLGGEVTEVRPSIFKIEKLPDSVRDILRNDYSIHWDTIRSILFCFDKDVFIDYQNVQDLGRLHYINPGNPLFDSLVKVVRELYREDMLKGTVLISPDDKDDYFAFFVKSQIIDNRPSQRDDSVADEQLSFVYQSNDEVFHTTSSAKFIDLHPPAEFAKPIEPPSPVSNNTVIEWSFENITRPQFDTTKKIVKVDAERRKEYLETAFTHVIMDTQGDISELQSKVLMGDTKAQKKIDDFQQRVDELIEKKKERLENLDRMMQLTPKEPNVLGCAYVVPLTQVEYKSHYGMSRDDEAEAIAMEEAMNFEKSDGWNPEDVSAENEGYDIRSVSPDELKRYIEVKGRSGNDGSVMLSENEINRLGQLGENAWLYIIMNCKSKPALHRIQNPANQLNFEMKSKGVQYFLPMVEWEGKSIK